MELFLIRHAIAVPATAEMPDAARPLTPEGSAKLERVIGGLDRLGIRFDRLYHSPWTRAVQTADALVALLRGSSAVELGLARAPDAALIGRLEGERVAAVGHEPWMSQLLSMLVTGSADHGERLPLRKAGLAWLEGDRAPGAMRLVAHLPPRVLRRL
jgi:phosphohistidine phosphatase